jgi:hypothetical protein
LTVSSCREPAWGCQLGFVKNGSKCNACPVGRYADAFNLTSCHDCPIGKFNDKLTGVSVCSTCPRHTYQNNTGSTTCVQCSIVEDSAPGSISKSNCTPNFCLGYVGTSSGSSTTYYLGHSQVSLTWFQAQALCSQTYGAQLATSLYPLPLSKSFYRSGWFRQLLQAYYLYWTGARRLQSGGFNFIFANRTIGDAIDPSMWSSSGQPGIGNCIINSNQDAKFQTRACSNTTAYYICEVDRKTYCTQPCDVGNYFNTAVSSCAPCPTGTYSIYDSVSSCTNCPAGKQSNVTGATVCTSCPYSKYSDVDGGNCKTCPKNAVTLVTSSKNLQDCICNVGFYGSAFTGADCLPCDAAAMVCDYNTTIPFINPGYWKDPRSEQVFLCIPFEACNFTGQSASTLCGDGYTGVRCGECSSNFYKINGVCKKCGSETLKWISLAGAILVLAVILMKLTSINTLAVPGEFRVAYQWIQIIGLFPSLFDQWPDLLFAWLRIFSFFNIDLDFVSPQCTFNVGFWKLLHVKMMFPLIVIAVIMLIGFLYNSIGWIKLRTFQAVDFRILPFRVPVFIFSLSYTYLFVQLSKPFACIRQGDGSYTLVASSNLSCFDTTWRNNLGGVVFYIIFYVLVIPGIAAFFFWRNKNDPRDPLFLQRFGLITNLYRIEIFWWELITVMKKAIFAITANIFTSFLSSTTRHFVTLCILFIFFMTEIVSLPYLTDLTNKCNLL